MLWEDPFCSDRNQTGWSQIRCKTKLKGGPKLMVLVRWSQIAMTVVKSKGPQFPFRYAPIVLNVFIWSCTCVSENRIWLKTCTDLTLNKNLFISLMQQLNGVESQTTLCKYATIFFSLSLEHLRVSNASCYTICLILEHVSGRSSDQNREETTVLKKDERWIKSN